MRVEIACCSWRRIKYRTRHTFALRRLLFRPRWWNLLSQRNCHLLTRRSLHQRPPDVIEIPGLTSSSEALLKQLDGLPQAEKPKILEQLSGTPEGKQALDEAKTIVQALEQRFGSSDPRALKKENTRLGARGYR